MKKAIGFVIVIVLVAVVIYFGWLNPLAVSNKKKCTIEVCDGRDNDCDKLIDENLPINCRTKLDCGADDWIGDQYCGADGNVHRNLTNYTCEKPNTCNSKCSSVTFDRVYKTCNAGCLNGECKNPDSCKDSDNGKASGVRGTVSGYLNNVVYNLTDYCNTTFKVVEYYCSGNKYDSIALSCPNRTICTEGACK